MFFSANTTKTFIELFNQIDKALDTILEKDHFCPFNEKIKEIIHGEYGITPYINHHKDELKHLGEIRNELIHGKKIKGKERITPTRTALKQLQHHQKAICAAPPCSYFFHTPPQQLSYELFLHGEIQEIIQKHLDYQQQYLPLYQEQIFMGVSNLFDLKAHTTKKRTDLIDHTYSFVRQSSSLYNIEKIFFQQQQEYHQVGIIFFTASGNKHDHITGYATTQDIPRITKHLQ